MESDDLTKKSSILNEVKWGFASISISIMIVLSLSYKAYSDFAAEGIILVGTLYILYGYLRNVGQTFYQFADLYGQITKHNANLLNAFPIDEAFDEIKEEVSKDLPYEWNEIELKNINFSYNEDGSNKHVDEVNFKFNRGEKIALVGESGSGKTTLALSLIRSTPPTSGQIFFESEEVTKLSEKNLKPFRKNVQMVFQDPYSSLDPRMNVGQVIGEPLKAHFKMSKSERNERAAELLVSVGLNGDFIDRRASQFSGGQRQRIAIARALALDPKVVIADEPVSALDVSTQAQIVNLLQKIQEDRNISYVLVSHDLRLVYHLATRVVVMYLGRVVEEGNCDDVVANPQHPYTAALLSAVPALDEASRRDRIVLNGAPPSPIARPTGCSFHPRCPIARPECATNTPELQSLPDGRKVACFFPGELQAHVSFTSSK
jgi:oligopeptide/dipeptide ABC transporter ATP-binding protein